MSRPCNTGDSTGDSTDDGADRISAKEDCFLGAQFIEELLIRLTNWVSVCVIKCGPNIGQSSGAIVDKAGIGDVSRIIALYIVYIVSSNKVGVCHTSVPGQFGH